MKATLTLLTFLTAVAFATAQSNVTFAVDMNGVEGFNPDTDVVRVAGAFQAPDMWTPTAAAGDNILTDDDGNGVYSVVYTVAAPGTYQFKYVINDWGTNEFPDNEKTGDCNVDGGNREEEFTAGDVELTIYKYNTCDESDLSIVSGTRDFTELAGVSVGPNPATDYATVALPAGSSYDVRVLSVDGRVLREVNQYTASSYEISDLPAGLYAVEVVDANRGERAVVRVSFQ